MPQYDCSTYFKDVQLVVTAKNRKEAVQKRNKLLLKMKVTRLIDRNNTEVIRR